MFYKSQDDTDRVNLNLADFLEMEVRRRNNDEPTFHRHKVQREKDGIGANKYQHLSGLSKLFQSHFSFALPTNCFVASLQSHGSGSTS